MYPKFRRALRHYDDVTSIYYYNTRSLIGSLFGVGDGTIYYYHHARSLTSAHFAEENIII